MRTDPRAQSYSQTAEAVQSQLADLVKLSLIQAGDMQAVTAEAAEISERISRLTPPPERPEAKG